MRQRLGRFLGWVSWLGLVLSSGGSLAQDPQRIASLNVCTDQLLLALADRRQIASLSKIARDPSLSFLAQQAAGLPLNEGGAEALLFSRPDLVLTGTHGSQEQLSLLRRQGFEVLALGPWASLEDGRAQIRLLARRLGHPERGEALIAQIEAALKEAKDIIPGMRSILAYERGGWVMASDAPMNELLAHMGFTLHQEALGLSGGGMARLETIVAAPPDFLLVDENDRRPVDNGTGLFAHPALKAAVPLERQLDIPGRLTICWGPSTPEAIEHLKTEVKAKVR